MLMRRKGMFHNKIAYRIKSVLLSLYHKDIGADIQLEMCEKGDLKLKFKTNGIVFSAI
mgnify:CR=1 FL=1